MSREEFENYEEESLSEDLRRVREDMKKIGGKAVKRYRRDEDKRLLFAKVIKIFGIILIVIAAIMSLSMLFKAGTLDSGKGSYGEFADLIGVSSAIYEAQAMMRKFSLFTFVLVSTPGIIFVSLGYILESIVHKEIDNKKIISLLRDNNEMIYYQNSLIEENLIDKNND